VKLKWKSLMHDNPMRLYYILLQNSQVNAV
jgi:hypothetical protein